VALSSRQVVEELSSLGTAILDALPINCYVVDRRMRVVAWNRTREKGPLGLPRREVLGRHLREVLSESGFRATLPHLRRAFDEGRGDEGASESRDGSRLFYVRRLPITRAGKVTHVASWFEDITDQRALELRLIASDRLAYLGQLVAGVAHEVANPLASIAGCAEALASLATHGADEAKARETREFLELIRGEVARCERLVRSLVDSARADPSRNADVAAVVATALRLLERHPAFAKVRVESRIPEGLPAAGIDGDSLKQVIMALASNAAQAMPGGGRLWVEGRAAEGGLQIDVRDSGGGVPAHLRSRIFEPFFTTKPGQGTGLGLAIARTLVRGRGGDLVYVPRRVRGALFRVRLRTSGAKA
jgi:PAS domain S-box-containing protein